MHVKCFLHRVATRLDAEDYAVVRKNAEPTQNPVMLDPKNRNPSRMREDR